MNYTERTTRSWGSRIGGAATGALVGLVLLLGSIVLLFWNEGRAIHVYRALAEGAGLVVEVDAGEPDGANDGKLVHVSGPVTPGAIPEDPDFAVTADGALRLERRVEMYQWVEKSDSKTEKKLGGGEETVTTYSYSKSWKEEREKSEEFKQPEGHENPDMPVSSQRFDVDNARVGGFSTDGPSLANLANPKPVKLSQQDLDAFAAYFGEAEVSLRGAGIYAGANPASPGVGDIRISYERGDLGEASIIGQQADQTIGPYQASNGEPIFLHMPGKVPASAMFRQAQDDNAMFTWLLRILGVVLMMVGFSLLFALFSVLADIVPFVGSIVAFGTTMLALLLTLVLGPLVIALGWFAYRPLLALGILAGGAALAAIVWVLRRRQVAPSASGVVLGRQKA